MSEGSTTVGLPKYCRYTVFRTVFHPAIYVRFFQGISICQLHIVISPSTGGVQDVSIDTDG